MPLILGVVQSFGRFSGVKRRSILGQYCYKNENEAAKDHNTIILDDKKFLPSTTLHISCLNDKNGRQNDKIFRYFLTMTLAQYKSVFTFVRNLKALSMFS